MKTFALVVAAVGLLGGGGLASSPKSASLQGVWQVVEVTTTGPGAATLVIPAPRPNLTIFTAKHYSRVELHAEAPRPLPADVTKASAEELRAAWGPFFGEAGTYEVTGDIITMRPMVAKSAAAMTLGAFSTYTFKLEGDTLQVTAQKNQNGAIPNPVTIKAVRVE